MMDKYNIGGTFLKNLSGPIDNNNPLYIHNVGKVSVNNSSTSTLGAGAVFTGTGEDVLNESVLIVTVFSNVASATDGLSIQWSPDNTNWDGSDVFTIAAGTQKTFTFQPVTRYFRIVYTNGGTIQTSFRLQVILKSTYIKPSSHRVADSVSSQDDAELTKSIITGQDPNGVFQNVHVNMENAISVTNFYTEIGRGNIPGMKMFSIPGRKNSLSTSALDDLTEIPSTIVVPSPGGIQLEAVSSSANDTSGGTGVRTIDIHYLDSSGLEQEETIIMNGTTPVNTVATDIDYVQWIHTKTVGSGGVSAGSISIRDTAGAVTYEYLAVGGNQSLSAKYKVPTGKTGYVIGWQCSGITKRIDLRLRATVERFDRSVVPGVFLFQDVLVLNDTTSGWIPFEVPLRMPAGAEIKLSGVSSAAGGDGAGQFDILLIND